MDVKVEKDVSHVVAAGELDAASAPALTGALDRARLDGRAIHLDLEGVSFIDSSGIRVIAQEMRTSNERGTSFAVTAASRPVRRLFEMTGLNAAFA